jgi:hypothetical protein
MKPPYWIGVEEVTETNNDKNCSESSKEFIGYDDEFQLFEQFANSGFPGSKISCEEIRNYFISWLKSGNIDAITILNAQAIVNEISCEDLAALYNCLQKQRKDNSGGRK